MSTASITFKIDTDNLSSYADSYLAQLWHIAQANPAEFGNAQACNLAEMVGREIVRRWLAATPPELWHHQGRHATARTTNQPATEV